MVLQTLVAHERKSFQQDIPCMVYIRTNVKGLDYPLVPFAVLKHDPIEHFQQHIRSSCPEMQEISIEAIYDAWNELFVGLAKAQNFFLYAWSSVPGISSPALRAMGLYFVIATLGPLRMRWITTRPVWHKGELVTWCEPVDMSHRDPSYMVEIVLSEERMLRLTPTRLEVGSIVV